MLVSCQRNARFKVFRRNNELPQVVKFLLKLGKIASEAQTVLKRVYGKVNHSHKYFSGLKGLRKNQNWPLNYQRRFVNRTNPKIKNEQQNLENWLKRSVKIVI
jgi:hypothetical protein